MWKVLNLNLDNSEDTSVLALEFKTPNIRLRLAHGRRNIRVETASIARFNRKSDVKALALNFLPVNFKSPLRLVVEQHQIGTIRAMYADTATACHVPGNRITGNWLTTLCVPNEQPVSALNPYTPTGSANAIDQSLQSVGAWWFLAGIDLRMQVANYVAAAQFALAYRTHEMRTIRQLKPLRSALEVVVRWTCNATALGLLVDHLATELDGGLLFLHAESLLDAMARSTGAHVCKPVAIGPRGW